MFKIELTFQPESFGEDFNKVASMEISSYLNRKVPTNYNEPINNIVCLDFFAYQKIARIPDINLTTKDIVKGCQVGFYHPRERTLPIKQSDIP